MTTPAWNVLLGWPIYSDTSVSYTPTFSGGSWLAALPLTNLQDRRLHRVARSTDAAAASTVIDIDLGVARAVRLISLHGHNLSSAATMTVIGGTSPGSSSAHSSGTVTPWPSGLTAEQLEGLSWGAFDILTADATARYWRISITDTTNPAGFVEVGRLCICGGIQPTINLQYGTQLGLDDPSTRTLTDGSSGIYAERPRLRTVVATLAGLPQDEALTGLWRMMRIAGTTRQFVFVFNPIDTTHRHERSFLAVLRSLSPMEQAAYARYSTPLALVEDL